ncbi:hypothetical protein D5R81_00920 [Parashewanella spongiae]|uniref:Uncharacterized protein n=1 Tax=Parashewanella spongiae TaxID=342950 RepID=A0A3A6UNM1_9GAMM|nr:hypothetical protein [Parashewanella spongiae]MCL1079980.1 hypothetical protein [Parashewanella spongiae]RJY19413.1 hypothetical protein D5R81_00920 [Parashewanella spongiae]
MAANEIDSKQGVLAKPNFIDENILTAPEWLSFLGVDQIEKTYQQISAYRNTLKVPIKIAKCDSTVEAISDNKEMGFEFICDESIEDSYVHISSTNSGLSIDPD